MKAGLPTGSSAIAAADVQGQGANPGQTDSVSVYFGAGKTSLSGLIGVGRDHPGQGAGATSFGGPCTVVALSQSRGVL